jgi:hypothetical protein
MDNKDVFKPPKGGFFITEQVTEKVLQVESTRYRPGL